MKKYLEVYLGSRGYLEGVEVKEFENIEEYLEEEKKRNLGSFDEDEYVDEEDEGYYDWGIDLDGNYYLGLGDEEEKKYIDMESEKFIKWKEENGIGEDVDWNEIEDVKIKDFLER